MNRRYNKNRFKAFSSPVNKKKLYKKGKDWVIGSLTLLAMAGLGQAIRHTSVHANTTGNTSSRVDNALDIQSKAKLIHTSLIAHQAANSDVSSTSAQNNQASSVANGSSMSSSATSTTGRKSVNTGYTMTSQSSVAPSSVARQVVNSVAQHLLGGAPEAAPASLSVFPNSGNGLTVSQEVSDMSYASANFNSNAFSNDVSTVSSDAANAVVSDWTNSETTTDTNNETSIANASGSVSDYNNENIISNFQGQDKMFKDAANHYNQQLPMWAHLPVTMRNHFAGKPQVDTTYLSAIGLDYNGFASYYDNFMSLYNSFESSYNAPAAQQRRQQDSATSLALSNELPNYNTTLSDDQGSVTSEYSDTSSAAATNTKPVDWLYAYQSLKGSYNAYETASAEFHNHYSQYSNGSDESTNASKAVINYNSAVALSNEVLSDYKKLFPAHNQNRPAPAPTESAAAIAALQSYENQGWENICSDTSAMNGADGMYNPNSDNNYNHTFYIVGPLGGYTSGKDNGLDNDGNTNNLLQGAGKIILDKTYGINDTANMFTNMTTAREISAKSNWDMTKNSNASNMFANFANSLGSLDGSDYATSVGSELASVATPWQFPKNANVSGMFSGTPLMSDASLASQKASLGLNSDGTPSMYSLGDGYYGLGKSAPVKPNPNQQINVQYQLIDWLTGKPLDNGKTFSSSVNPTKLGVPATYQDDGKQYDLANTPNLNKSSNYLTAPTDFSTNGVTQIPVVSNNDLVYGNVGNYYDGSDIPDARYAYNIHNHTLTFFNGRLEPNSDIGYHYNDIYTKLGLRPNSNYNGDYYNIDHLQFGSSSDDGIGGPVYAPDTSGGEDSIPDCEGLFFDIPELQSVGPGLILGGDQTFDHMFASDPGLTDISGLDPNNPVNQKVGGWQFSTYHGTYPNGGSKPWLAGQTFGNNFSDMFSNDTKLSDLSPISNWNTVGVIKMENMFRNVGNNASKSLNVTLNWNVQNVQNMYNMFASMFNLAQIHFGPQFNPINCTDFSSMFAIDKHLNHLNLSNWNNYVDAQGHHINGTHSAQDMSDMFNMNGSSDVDVQDESASLSDITTDSSNPNHQNHVDFDTSNVFDMENMFRGLSNIKKLDLSSFTGQSLVKMNQMFNDDMNLHALNLSNLDTTRALDQQGEVFNADRFLQYMTLNPKTIFVDGSGLSDGSNPESGDVPGPWMTADANDKNYKFYRLLGSKASDTPVATATKPVNVTRDAFVVNFTNALKPSQVLSKVKKVASDPTNDWYSNGDNLTGPNTQTSLDSTNTDAYNYPKPDGYDQGVKNGYLLANGNQFPLTFDYTVQNYNVPVIKKGTVTIQYVDVKNSNQVVKSVTTPGESDNTSFNIDDYSSQIPNGYSKYNKYNDDNGKPLSDSLLTPSDKLTNQRITKFNDQDQTQKVAVIKNTKVPFAKNADRAEYYLNGKPNDVISTPYQSNGPVNQVDSGLDSFISKVQDGEAPDVPTGYTAEGSSVNNYQANLPYQGRVIKIPLMPQINRVVVKYVDTGTGTGYEQHYSDGQGGSYVPKSSDSDKIYTGDFSEINQFLSNPPHGYLLDNQWDHHHNVKLAKNTNNSQFVNKPTTFTIYVKMMNQDSVQYYIADDKNHIYENFLPDIAAASDIFYTVNHKKPSDQLNRHAELISGPSTTGHIDPNIVNDMNLLKPRYLVLSSDSSPKKGSPSGSDIVKNIMQNSKDNKYRFNGQQVRIPVRPPRIQINFYDASDPSKIIFVKKGQAVISDSDISDYEPSGQHYSDNDIITDLKKAGYNGPYNDNNGHDFIYNWYFKDFGQKHYSNTSDVTYKIPVHKRMGKLDVKYENESDKNHGTISSDLTSSGQMNTQITGTPYRPKQIPKYHFDKIQSGKGISDYNAGTQTIIMYYLHDKSTIRVHYEDANNNQELAPSDSITSYTGNQFDVTNYIKQISDYQPTGTVVQNVRNFSNQNGASNDVYVLYSRIHSNALVDYYDTDTKKVVQTRSDGTKSDGTPWKVDQKYFNQLPDHYVLDNGYRSDANQKLQKQTFMISGAKPTVATIYVKQLKGTVAVHYVDDDNNGNEIESLPVKDVTGVANTTFNFSPYDHKYAPGFHETGITASIGNQKSTDTLPSDYLTTDQNVYVHYAHNRGRITINYLNVSDNQPLANAVSVSDYTGTPFKAAKYVNKSIPEYQETNVNPEPENVNEVTDNPQVIDVYYRHQIGKITIHYIGGNNRELTHVPLKTHQGNAGSDFSLQSSDYKNVPGYHQTLVSMTNGKYNTGTQDIYIHYTHNRGQITVNYLDASDKLPLSDSVTVSGNTGTSFTSASHIKSIKNYQERNVAPTNVTKITDQPQTINVYYEHQHGTVTVHYVGSDKSDKNELPNVPVKVDRGNVASDFVLRSSDDKILPEYHQVGVPKTPDKYQNGNQDVYIHYAKDHGQVTVNYLNSDKQPLTDPQTVSDKVGTSFSMNDHQKSFPGYHQVGIDDHVKTITDQPQTVNVYYARDRGKVIVKYVDTDNGKALASPVSDNGDVGTPFDLNTYQKSFSDYHQTNVKGQASAITSKPQTVEIDYARNKSMINVYYQDPQGNPVAKSDHFTSDTGTQFSITNYHKKNYQKIVPNYTFSNVLNNVKSFGPNNGDVENVNLIYDHDLGRVQIEYVDPDTNQTVKVDDAGQQDTGSRWSAAKYLDQGQLPPTYVLDSDPKYAKANNNVKTQPLTIKSGMNTAVIYIKQLKGTITVHYVNSDGKSDLPGGTAQSSVEPVGTPFQVQIKPFKGYRNTQITGSTDSYKNGDQNVYVHYVRDAGVITVNYLNASDGQPLTKSVNDSDNVGAPFKVSDYTKPQFNGFSEKPVKTDVTKVISKPQTVNIYYTRNVIPTTVEYVDTANDKPVKTVRNAGQLPYDRSWKVADQYFTKQLPTSYTLDDQYRDNANQQLRYGGTTEPTATIYVQQLKGTVNVHYVYSDANGQHEFNSLPVRSTTELTNTKFNLKPYDHQKVAGYHETNVTDPTDHYNDGSQDVYIHYAHDQGTITVHYLDASDGNQLAAPVNDTGDTNVPFKLGDYARSFAGYHLKSAQTNVTKITDQPQTVNVYYAKDQSYVHVHYVNSDDHEFGHSDVTGKVGSPFNINDHLETLPNCSRSILNNVTAFSKNNEAVENVFVLYSRNYGKVTVNYLSLSDGKPVAPSVSDNAKVGAPFDLSDYTKQIDGYQQKPSDTKGDVNQITAQPQTVDVYYVHNKVTPKQTTSSIDIHYVDSDGRPLSNTVDLNGKIGSPFNVNDHIKSINGYHETSALPDVDRFNQNNVAVYVVYQHNYGQITVNYLDAKTRQPIAKAYVANAKVGMPFNVADHEVNVNGYHFINVNNNTNIFAANPQTIDVYYDHNEVTPKQTKSSIDVHYVSSDGQTLSSDVDVTGQIGSRFNTNDYIKPINGYHETSVLPNVSQFNQSNATVYIVYQHNDGQITVNYLNSKTDQPLAHSYMTSAKVGTPFNVADHEMNIKGYQLIRTSGNAGAFTSTPQVINVYYAPDQAPQSSVQVNYVDTGTGQVVKTNLEGDLNVGSRWIISPSHFTQLPDNYVLDNRFGNDANDYLKTHPVTVSGSGTTFATIYVMHQKGAVTVNYVDNNGHQIAPSTGTIAQTGRGFDLGGYVNKSIPGYQFAGIVSGANVDEYTTQPQQVTLSYVKLNHPNHGIGDIDVFYYYNHHLEHYRDYGNYPAGTPFDLDAFKHQGFKIISGGQVKAFTNGLQHVVLSGQNSGNNSRLPSDTQVVPHSQINVIYIINGQLQKPKVYNGVVGQSFTKPSATYEGHPFTVVNGKDVHAFTRDPQTIIMNYSSPRPQSSASVAPQPSSSSAIPNSSASSMSSASSASVSSSSSSVSVSSSASPTVPSSSVASNSQSIANVIPTSSSSSQMSQTSVAHRTTEPTRSVSSTTSAASPVQSSRSASITSSTASQKSVQSINPQPVPRRTTKTAHHYDNSNVNSSYWRGYYDHMIHQRLSKLGGDFKALRSELNDPRLNLGSLMQNSPHQLPQTGEARSDASLYAMLLMIGSAVLAEFSRKRRHNK